MKREDRPRCDYCNRKADAKVGDKPEYLCAPCWLKFHRPNRKETKH